MATSAHHSDTIIQKIVQVAYSIEYQTLSPAAVRLAKQLLLDTLACAYGALDSDVSRSVLRAADYYSAAPEASIIGSRKKVSAPAAALVNGALIRYLDYNDYYFGRDPAHPSGAIAVALALGDSQRRSGPEILTALAAAYEVHLRLCDFAGEPSLWARGWHHSTNAQFGSTIAACRLNRLTAQQAAHALAISCSHQNTLANLQSGSISMIKATAEAWAAKSAIEASWLALCGITGPLEVIEGRHGWSSTIAGNINTAGLTSPLSGDTPLRLMDACLKPYPMVATALASVYAAIQLAHKAKPDPEDILNVEVGLPRFALESPSAHPGRRYPVNTESAQHSFYFGVAVGLSRGRCTDLEFSEHSLRDTATQNLLSKISLVHASQFDNDWPGSAGGYVQVDMKNGESHRVECPHPPGNPLNPIDLTQTQEKFLYYASRRLGSAKANELAEEILSIEDCTDLRDVSRLFS